MPAPPHLSPRRRAPAARGNVTAVSRPERLPGSPAGGPQPRRSRGVTLVGEVGAGKPVGRCEADICAESSASFLSYPGLSECGVGAVNLWGACLFLSLFGAG